MMGFGTDTEAVAPCCENAGDGIAISSPSVKREMSVLIAANRVVNFIKRSPDAWLVIARIEIRTARRARNLRSKTLLSDARRLTWDRLRQQLLYQFSNVTLQ